MPDNAPPTAVGRRLRSSSLTVAKELLDFNPQPGMWAATGTAIAYAPTLEELREPYAGGQYIEFNEHGHSARHVVTDEEGIPALSQVPTARAAKRANSAVVEGMSGGDVERVATVVGLVGGRGRPNLATSDEEKHGWKQTTLHGLHAFWKFVKTPTGFLMTIYGLNIVAWGAMLFFLLLDAAPAMDHPSADSDASPRKKWLEIDSQILNALFCVTGFGLAPWRFRDLYCLEAARFKHSVSAMKRLCKQNQAWFRPPKWYMEAALEAGDSVPHTFTGEVAPPTSWWKLSFVVWMMCMNTFLQAVLSGFMWGYNRFDRPSWATGTFIAMGCGVSLAAGVMMWWEGRRVKRIEGPLVKVVDGDSDSDGAVEKSS